MQRVLKILTWVGIAVWFAVVLGFISGESAEVICNRIEVVMSDTVNNRFVTRTEIRHMLEDSRFQLQGYSLDEINIRKLEKMLEENPYVGNAEVSKDISGRLMVKVDQRVPLVRILPEGKSGYYLDIEGAVLPISDKFTPLIMLVSGKIPGPGPDGEPSAELKEIYRFCKYIDRHPFWRDQVVQVYLNRNGEYELIPRVGAHQILLGSMDQWEKKLKNLELLYEQGLSRYGWNSYSTINLKYSNQVICTKR